MTEPIPVQVTRYRCPHCGRSRAHRKRIADHIPICWVNPEARGCKTCAHFEPLRPREPDTGWPEEPEGCAVGVDLTGRAACPACGGTGWALTNVEAAYACSEATSTCHVGDGMRVRPGPIVGCEKWEAKP